MEKKKVTEPLPKKEDLPAMPFYIGDWFKCPEVRALRPDHRGLWFDLICFMWQSPERGVMIKSTFEPYTEIEIIRMVGNDAYGEDGWLKLLLSNGVCRKREDGAIYSPFMLRQEEARLKRKENGRKGGNPNVKPN